MEKNLRFVGLGTLTTLGLLGSIIVCSAASQKFQKTPIVLLASEVLPKPILIGPSYRIKAHRAIQGIQIIGVEQAVIDDRIPRHPRRRTDD
jgi:hypothetical protein